MAGLDQNNPDSLSAFDGTLVGGVHERPVRVYFEDTDFSGVVYHAAYLKFMERGRSDFLRCLNLSHAALSQTGAAFGVAHMDIRFQASAAIDELLLVRTEIARVSGVRIVFDQTVVCGEATLVTAAVTVALIRNGKAQRLPANMLSAFRDVSNSA